MARGETYPAEWLHYTDPVTGAAVTQLTHFKAHSHHLYFTNPGWFDGGRRLLIGSDRGNHTDLYGVDLQTGALTQLTDRLPLAQGQTLLDTTKNPRREEAYFWSNRELMALDIKTFELRALCRAPEGFTVTMANVTADGRYVCTGVYEDLSARFHVDLEHGYIGFAEYWAARPWSRVLRVDVDSGHADTVWEERSWIGHINTSPALPHLMTFCHEGPWDKVDNRIWGLDLSTGRAWKIRPTEPGERVGHEYWLADGEHIGFHGAYGPGRGFYGSIRYDNSEHVEAAFPGNSWHFHSNALDLIVSDGTSDNPYVLLWRFRNGRFEGPKALVFHRGSFHTQIQHVHPRFSPDGRQVLYSCDPDGYGNVCLVDVPEYDTLVAPPTKA